MEELSKYILRHTINALASFEIIAEIIILVFSLLRETNYITFTCKCTNNDVYMLCFSVIQESANLLFVLFE